MKDLNSGSLITRLFLAFLLPLAMYAQTHKTAEEIQQELNEAESHFKRSQEMFNPWDAGPLVTPSASMMPPGQANIQPYLSVTGQLRRLQSQRQSIALLHNSYQLKAIVPMQIGVTDSTDIAVNFGGQANWSERQTGGGFNDISVTYGFSIFKETLYIPKFKFTIAKTFPTWKYKNLSTNGLNLNATGGGSYQTTFGFATGKVIWWTYLTR